MKRYKYYNNYYLTNTFLNWNCKELFLRLAKSNKRNLSVSKEYTNALEDHNLDISETVNYANIENKSEETSYDINWTKDYKNLSTLLSLKGLNISDKNTHDLNNTNYLVFSLTLFKNLSNKTWKNKEEKELLYSLRLILLNSSDKLVYNSLYQKILNNLKNNFSFIKDGGNMDIFYVTYKLDKGIKEAFRFKDENDPYRRKELLPSLEEEINLYKNKLIIKFYMFTYDTFFREFLTSNYVNRFNRITTNKILWGYPFLIIEGLNLATVTYLFKEAGINAHGMSITWRHKLSPLQENLSNFLYLTDLNESIQSSHLCYSDNIFSNNKVDLNLYKEIYTIQEFDKKNLTQLYEKIEDLDSLELPQEKEIKRYTNANFNDYKSKSIEYLSRKIAKIEKRTMSPLVLILILRNHIQELEDQLTGLTGKQSQKLSSYTTLANHIESLISNKEGTAVIIDNLLKRKNKLELVIKNQQIAVDAAISEADADKLKNQKNKKMRKDAILSAKNKSKKKSIRKKLMPNISELNLKNRKRIEKETLLRRYFIEKEEVSKQWKNEELSLISLNNSLDDKKANQSELLLAIKIEKNKLEKLQKDINLKQNSKFSVDSLQRFNNRGKTFYRNKYWALVGKREYSTLNLSENPTFSLQSTFLLEVKRIIDNYPVSAQTQKLIEEYSLFQSNEILKEKNSQDLSINYQRLNPYVQRHLSNQINEITLMIQNYKTNLTIIDNKQEKCLNFSDKIEAQILLNLDNDIILSLIFGRLLRIVSLKDYHQGCNLTELSKDLGTSLMWEYFYLEHQKFKKLIKSKKENSSESEDKICESLKEFIISNPKLLFLWKKASEEYLIQMGIRLLNFLEEANLTESKILQHDWKLRTHVVLPSNLLISDFKKSLDSLNISSNLPMISKPKLYSRDKGSKTEKLGGFLLNDEKYIQPLIIERKDNKEKSTIETENKIYSLVNNLNSTGYKINQQVLNFILTYGVKYQIITDFNGTHPLENLKTKRKLIKQEKKKLEAYFSIKTLEKNILGLALTYQNANEFFIPVRLDNRGRVYCMVDYLNYQGIELAKSLLLFSQEVKINLSDTKAISFLKIYGANCFGNGIDKNSFNDRIKWVNENEEDIINFQNGKLLEKADNKAIFIGFCFEYQKYFNSKASGNTCYYSNFPIKLDATCNGFQHISLLLGDLSLAKLVNIPSPDSFEVAPLDLYMFIAGKVTERLKLMTSSYQIELKGGVKDPLNWGTTTDMREKINASCIKWLRIVINRALIKTVVMVRPYNATVASRADYLRENSTEVYKDNKQMFTYDGFEFEYGDFMVYSTVIDKVISAEFPKLVHFTNYLSDIAKICNTLNIPIIWRPPAGLTVKQYYVESDTIQIKPFKFSKTVFNLNKPKKVINKIKQNRALFPNLIHSLDASSLALLVDSFYNFEKNVLIENVNFYAIHDCFATTANNMVNLINLLKAVYIQTYTEESFLIKFDKDIKEWIQLFWGSDVFNKDFSLIKVEINDKLIKMKYPNVQNVIVGKISALSIQKGFGGLS